MQTQNNEEQHMCNFCGKTFSKKGNLKTHQEKTKRCLDLRNIRAKVIYTCNYCKKEFTVKDSYETHLVKHVTNPVQKENDELKLKYAVDIERLETKLAAKENECLSLTNNYNNALLEIERLKEELSRDRDIIAKIALKKSRKTTINGNVNNTNNYIIKVEDLQPINAETIKNHTFDMKYLTYYEIGEGIGKFIADTVLKDNSYWSDKARKVLSWRKDDILVKDFQANQLWNLIIEVWGQKLIRDIEKLRNQYSSKKDLEPEDKFRLMRDCTKAVQDILQSKELHVETPTQREFLNYIYKNSGSKEDLINIIMKRLEPDIYEHKSSEESSSDEESSREY
jgi:hypothetical protein